MNSKVKLQLYTHCISKRLKILKYIVWKYQVEKNLEQSEITLEVEV